MKKVLFVDFEDSFSHNVIQELKSLSLQVTYIHWRDFDHLPDVDLLVLGPGPGNPIDYQTIFPLIQSWMDLKKSFFGICLGHQIFWLLRGALIDRSHRPVHGQKVKMKVDRGWEEFLKLSNQISVQRYNSLAVYLGKIVVSPNEFFHLESNEIMMARGDHYLTYQFHPESEGTMCRGAFFRPILDFLV